jgi:hypothetical protein
MSYLPSTTTTTTTEVPTANIEHATPVMLELEDQCQVDVILEQTGILSKLAVKIPRFGW